MKKTGEYQPVDVDDLGTTTMSSQILPMTLFQTNQRDMWKPGLIQFTMSHAPTVCHKN